MLQFYCTYSYDNNEDKEQLNEVEAMSINVSGRSVDWMSKVLLLCAPDCNTRHNYTLMVMWNPEFHQEKHWKCC